MLVMSLAMYEPTEKFQPVEVPVDAGGSWDTEREVIVAPDPKSKYGFHTGQERHACTREDLVCQCCAEPATPFVWTPDTGGMVRPESVSVLVEQLARHLRHRAEREIQWYALGLVAVLSIYALWLPRWGFRSILVLVPALLAIRLVGAVHARVEALRTDATAFPAARARLRHAAWIQAQPARYTKTLLGVLITVFVAEMFVDREAAIQAAGLVKPAVRNGELWRLLTGPLLHANTMHIWFNGGALLASGRLVEIHSRQEYLPLTFLIGSLMGSVASVAAYPETTSVGASGGIMGLIGFLLVLGFRRRESLPPGFTGGILVSVAATAALGIVGFAMIDNAGHLGGLIVGALLGGALERRGTTYSAGPFRSQLYGHLASAVLIAGAVTAIIAMYN